MYPIDSIKVRHYCSLSRDIAIEMGVDIFLDPNANPESDPFRSLQWHCTRRIPNSDGGGNPQSLERHV